MVSVRRGAAKAVAFSVLTGGALVAASSPAQAPPSSISIAAAHGPASKADGDRAPGPRTTGEAIARVLGGERPACELTLCMRDAAPRDARANPEFLELCQALPGVLPSCDGPRDEGSCESAFDGFDLQRASEALFSAADTNGDGNVGEGDEDCRIQLVGYGWGAMNLSEVARRYLQDRRVQPVRARIHRMVAIAPYKPVLAPVLDVPPGVEKFWEYRHSIPPAGDCSADAPLGPYVGKPPRCAPGTMCRDYDYSLSPSESFESPFGSYLGVEVGLCSIVHVAFDAVVHNVMHGTDYAFVPSLPQPATTDSTSAEWLSRAD